MSRTRDISENAWEVLQGGRVHGPLSRDDLAAWARDGRLQPLNIIREAGAKQWRLVSSSPELRHMFAPPWWVLLEVYLSGIAGAMGVIGGVSAALTLVLVSGMPFGAALARLHRGPPLLLLGTWGCILLGALLLLDALRLRRWPHPALRDHANRAILIGGAVGIAFDVVVVCMALLL
jgi:hypothetical protein